MANIIQLDEHLSNMIAAGEVVERVSSVVKELVENSLDANATDIVIELTDSGIKEVKVIDNGCGMDSTDIKTSFLRHATSKIKNQYDLFRINTLGFRGEAIPSIASVSDMIIKSNNGAGGYFVHMKASKLVEEGFTPLNLGTEITVSNLFYNTPARLKYLKSENTELAIVCELIDKLALSNPKVRFKLINNKKIILQTSGNNNMKSIMGNIYGLATIKNLIEASNQANGTKIKCYLAEPLVNKSRKNGITIIVNGRSVKNYQLVNGVVEGYDTYIPVGRFPVGVIFIDLDPMLIDVNVHPTKSEIRVSNEEELKNLIKNTIKSALNNTRLIPNISDEFKNSPSKMSSYYNYKNEKDNNVSRQTEILLNINSQLQNEEVNKELKPLDNSSIFESEPIKEEKIEENIFDKKLEYEKQSLLEEEKEEYNSKLPYLEYIGQYAGTYLLFQNDKGLYLMDQHAAAERIRYEKYIKELSNPSNISQELLTPELIDVTKTEKIYILDNMDLFNNLGIELTDAGDNAFYIRSVPMWITNDPVGIVLEMIKHIVEKKTIDIKSIRDELAKLISCKGAIKANRYTSITEVNALVAQLSKCENPFTCPHGRPTIISFTEYEIQKMFLRVM